MLAGAREASGVSRQIRFGDLTRAALVWLVFLFVFGCRAALIREYGSPLPFWDEWDFEGNSLYPAYLKGDLNGDVWFAAHNEHRILFTRLQSLALFAATHAWEPRVQMTVNAGWMALTAAGLAWILLLRIPGRAGAGLAGLVGVLFAAPHSWQNTLWGFQSQNAFQLLAGVVLIGLVAAPRRSWSAIVAMAVVGGGGLFTTGAGVLVPLAVAGIFLVQWLHPKLRQRRDLVVVAICGAVALLGWWLAVDVPGHAWLKSKSVATFAAVFLHGMAWPGMELWFFAPILWAPLVILGVALARGRMTRTPGSDLALLCGVWTALHAASVAWARGAGMAAQLPLSRYLDGLMPGVIGNALALALLSGGTGRDRWWFALRSLWIAGLALGLAHQTYTDFHVQLPLHALSKRTQLLLVGAYVRSGDASILAGRNVQEIGHHDPASIRRVVDDPAKASWLPTAARKPLEVVVNALALQTVEVPASGFWEIEFPVAEAEGGAGQTLIIDGEFPGGGKGVASANMAWGRRAWVHLAAGPHQLTFLAGTTGNDSATIALRPTHRARVYAERVLGWGAFIAWVAIALAAILWIFALRYPAKGLRP